jgi:hypothetical protein
MPVLGLVISHPAPHALVPLLREVPGFSRAGAPTGARLPVVFTTETKAEDEPLLEALRALPGVGMVDLAFADFSDLHPPARENP